VKADTWVAIGAALIALGALFLNWLSTRAAVRAANAAEDQTKIQKQLRIDAAQPYVWADIRPDDAQGQVLNVVVGNSGPTTAEKVRITFDPPLPAIDQLAERARIAQTILADGIESLPPGRVLTWPLGQAFVLMNAKGPQAFKVNITARGPFGQIPALSYIVDMTNWRESRDQPTGSLFQLTKAVRELGNGSSS
jgi:hypothetical protein